MADKAKREYTQTGAHAGIGLGEVNSKPRTSPAYKPALSQVHPQRVLSPLTPPLAGHAGIWSLPLNREPGSGQGARRQTRVEASGRES